MDNELLITLLNQYNRLIIPNFGAFLKKKQAGANVVVFTPFLKIDDGILREAIVQRLDITDSQASSVIVEFVAQVRSAIEQSSRYYITDLGTIKHDANGALSFIYEPKVITIEPIIEQKSEPVVTRTIPIPEPKPEPVVTRPVPIPEPKLQPQPQPQPIAPRPAPIRPPQPIQSPMTAPRSASPMQGIPPAPRPINRRPNVPPQHQSPQRPRPTGRPKQPSTTNKIKNLPKTDLWLLFAIIAALSVIALLTYGYLNSDPQIILNPEVEQGVDSLINN